MTSKTSATALALTLMVVSPPAAWAFGGIGCTDLPEYDRAQGALQGMTGACDMTIEQARRIVAAHDGQPVVEPAPGSRRHRRHPRYAPPQP